MRTDKIDENIKKLKAGDSDAIAEAVTILEKLKTHDLVDLSCSLVFDNSHIDYLTAESEPTSFDYRKRDLTRSQKEIVFACLQDDSGLTHDIENRLSYLVNSNLIGINEVVFWTSPNGPTFSEEAVVTGYQQTGYPDEIEYALKGLSGNEFYASTNNLTRLISISSIGLSGDEVLLEFNQPIEHLNFSEKHISMYAFVNEAKALVGRYVNGATKSQMEEWFIKALDDIQDDYHSQNDYGPLDVEVSHKTIRLTTQS